MIDVGVGVGVVDFVVWPCIYDFVQMFLSIEIYTMDESFHWVVVDTIPSLIQFDVS